MLFGLFWVFLFGFNGLIWFGAYGLVWSTLVWFCVIWAGLYGLEMFGIAWFEGFLLRVTLCWSELFVLG